MLAEGVTPSPCFTQAYSVSQRPIDTRFRYENRSNFRDWCGDSGVAREVAESCLAHVVKNQVEAAYARSDLLERRREAMQKWADYVSKTA